MDNTSARIIINTSTRQLSFHKGNDLLLNFPVAVGKQSTPTPNGTYQIVNKIISPGGILGSRWMGLDIPGGIYGIHGTNNPNSIGNAVSNGCIRLHNQDIEQLYSQVSIGTPVTITSEKMNYNHDMPTSKYQQGFYIVKPGDTFWKISQRLNIPLKSLISANKNIDPNNIYPGQKLFIP